MIISYIKGKVSDKNQLVVIIESNGIGYELFMSQRDISLLILESNVIIYTNFILKEDFSSIYGFINRQERDMFRHLIRINGIGPRIALNVLSQMTYNDLSSAITRGDCDVLAKIQGIGQKTAKRIMLDMGEKILKYNNKKEVTVTMNQYELDALEVLISIGYKKSDAVIMIQKYIGKQLETSNIIKSILKEKN